MEGPLTGKVALAAGATPGSTARDSREARCGRGTVYATGRTTRSERSEMDRPETIAETAARVDQAGGRGIGFQVDHLVSDEVRAPVARIEEEQGALHVLVNASGAPRAWESDKTAWKSSLDIGLHTLRLASTPTPSPATSPCPC